MVFWVLIIINCLFIFEYCVIVNMSDFLIFDYRLNKGLIKFSCKMKFLKNCNIFVFEVNINRNVLI